MAETDWAMLADPRRDGRVARTELGHRVDPSASATTPYRGVAARPPVVD